MELCGTVTVFGHSTKAKVMHTKQIVSGPISI